MRIALICVGRADLLCVFMRVCWVSSRRTAVVAFEKKKPGNNKKNGGGKRPIHVSDEVRNFNERMAGQKKRSEAVKYQAKSLSIAPPTFVVAAPTFSLYVCD